MFAIAGPDKAVHRSVMRRAAMPKTVLLWTSKASDERPSTRCEVPTDCAGGHLRHLSRSAWRRLPRFGEVQRMSGLGTKRCCMRTAEGSAFWGKADALISASDRREVAGLCASLPTLPPRTAAKMAENRGLSWDGGQIRRETDCLLEGSGFELLVPRQIRQRFRGFVRDRAE